MVWSRFLRINRVGTVVLAKYGNYCEDEFFFKGFICDKVKVDATCVKNSIVLIKSQKRPMVVLSPQSNYSTD